MGSEVNAENSILAIESSKMHLENGRHSQTVDFILVTQLQLELEKLRKELHEKSTECEKLQEGSTKVNAELEDLTASLFEEANKMVYDANVKRQKAQKKLAEAEGNIDALHAEVEALKSLVLTSTPSNPNRQSHPQIKKRDEIKLLSPLRLHKRNSTPSDTRIRKSPISEKPSSSSSSQRCGEFSISGNNNNSLFNINKMQREINSGLYDEVSKWHRSLQNDNKYSCDSGMCNCSNQTILLEECQNIRDSPFLRRVYEEDISHCLEFQNQELASEVSKCIHKNSLCVELISNPVVLGKCSLTGLVTQCRHRICFSDSETSFPISQSSRNRLTSVCDFLTYIRYTRQGLVKHTVEQSYWKIIRLRTEMSLARLGYYGEQT